MIGLLRCAGLAIASLVVAAPVPPPVGKPVLVATLKQDDEVAGVWFSPDGKSLHVTFRVKNRVAVWDVRGSKLRAVLRNSDEGIISAVRLSRDGSLLATQWQDKGGAIRLWDPVAATERLTLGPGHFGTFDISPDGKLLAVVEWDPPRDPDGAVRLRDAATGKPVGSLADRARPEVMQVTFSPDGKTLATSHWDDNAGRARVRLWDVATREERASFGGSAGIFEFAFAPDGKTIAAWGSSDLTAVYLVKKERAGVVELTLRDAATGREKAALAGHREMILTGAFSSDGKTLATVGGPLGEWLKDPADLLDVLDPKPRPPSNRGEVRLWDVTTGRARASLGRRPDPVTFVAFSPDGRLLATIDGDRIAKRPGLALWDATTGRHLLDLTDHLVTAAAFSPDGKTLATGCADRAVRLWDVSGVGRGGKR